MRLIKDTPRVRATWLDRAIAWVAPQAGVGRLTARMQFAAAGGYDGARDRRNRRPAGGAGGPQTGPDQALLPDLPELRAQCQELMRNAPIARGAINTKVTSVIGSGLVPQAEVDRAVLQRALGVSDQWCDAVEDAIETEFWAWADSPDCDLAREQTFWEQQDLAYRTAKVEGDCFAVRRYVERPGRRLGTVIQTVAGARVGQPDWQRDTPELAGGIAKDKDGAATSIHVYRRYPGDPDFRASDYDTVPVYGRSGLRQVHHVYRRLQDGQSRGEPDLAPVLAFLKTAHDYTDSELTAADVASRFTVFVKTITGAGPAVRPLLDAGTGGSGGGEVGELELAAGAILGLGANQEIQIADPKRPNTAFGEFIKSILQQIGVALELPYELVVKHFTASYSASQAALVLAYAYFVAERAWFVRRHSQPIREAVIAEAAARERLRLPGFFSDPLLRAAYCGASWIGPPRGQIDEEREISAAAMRIENNLSTHAAETARLTGGDWSAVRRRLQRERRELVETPGAAQPRRSPLPARPAQDPNDSDHESPAP
ncbi:phage portal protein [Azospirillum brasilense]|uniref:phage portal protein n=1 Tax=Azospirillum argentinense TaxID=2970906 RepID=UPI00190B32DB|nr:phage portal protein [Azospirillum argentinense]MBK3798634.1 phage portal protein [Azospirillum argentinense]